VIGGLVAALFVPVALGVAHAPIDPPGLRPAAIVDLATRDGVALVRGQWRYSDVRIVDSENHAVGADLKPSGKPIRAYDYAPHAGVAGFDDRAWTTIAADTLDARRAAGKLCFAWYRTAVTIPERVGRFDPTGATVAFEVVVDDYAEVWVDGALSTVLGQAGGNVVKGFNAPNRVILTRDAQPGHTYQVAVFAMNGPISASPTNFIWVKSATLDFFARDEPAPSAGRVVRVDRALDAIVSVDARVEKIADGFQFTEGPVWHPDGYLLFSDPDSNVIWRWSPDGALAIYRTKSGYRGLDAGDYHQPGSNGLTLDREHRLTINEHGNRRVTRLEKNGQLTVLADRYRGKRLNSPNDLVYRSDGALYFTDPPFGLPRGFGDANKELPYSGVFCLKDGELELAATDLKGPNGLAFSPDEKFLYVSNWDDKRKIILRYEVHADGSLASPVVFADLTRTPGANALDGMKVDARGDVFATGPGGIFIFAPDGKLLGRIEVTEDPHNLAWGDRDGKTLYIAAQTGVYRIRTNVAGTRAW
jgi:gluconolactonase